MGKLDIAAQSINAAIVAQPHMPSASGSCTGEGFWTVSDVIVSYLESLGIEYVFGIAGGAVDPLFGALARSARRGGLRLVSARHEAGAAFMADGYARETGKIGVCVATSGPGATNLITGVASAQQNGIPMLAITGQPPLPHFGRNPLQESACTGVDIVAMFRHCTCYNSLVSHVDQVRPKVAAALIAASEAPGGPSHLSIPVDILRSPMENAGGEDNLRRLLLRPKALVDTAAVAEVRLLLESSRQPVFLIGGNHTVGPASEAIVKLAERVGAALISTPDGKGFIDTRHPAYHGVFGLGGHESARALLAMRPDVIIAFGTSFGEFSSEGWSKAALNERLVHFDDSVEHLARSPMARLHVRGNIKANCEYLAEALDAQPLRPMADRAAPMRDRAPAINSRRVETGSGSPCIKPSELMAALSRHCPPQTRFVADTGNSFIWSSHCLEQGTYAEGASSGSADADQQPRHIGWLRMTMDFAAMGWAIGCAVGLARARPNQPVVCITGDGSYLMSGQEITVAQEQGLAVIFVVLNDGAYGMVMHGQRLSGAEPIGFELPKLNYSALAAAVGAASHVITSVADIDNLDWDHILERKGPTLLDVRIDREEIPPMTLRLKTLKSLAEVE